MDEKLYLVCDACGEVFDTIEIAYAHAKVVSTFDFIIKPESEAF